MFPERVINVDMNKTNLVVRTERTASGLIKDYAQYGRDIARAMNARDQAETLATRQAAIACPKREGEVG